MEELAEALLELDSISKFSDTEKNIHDGEHELNSDDDEEEEDDDDDDDDDDFTEHPNESNSPTVIAKNQADTLEKEYLKMQVKDYQQRLFQRTTMLEEMRKSYLRDVVVVKNIMKVIQIQDQLLCLDGFFQAI